MSFIKNFAIASAAVLLTPLSVKKKDDGAVEIQSLLYKLSVKKQEDGHRNFSVNVPGLLTKDNYNKFVEGVGDAARKVRPKHIDL